MEQIQKMGVLELAGQRIDIEGRSATLKMTYILLGVSVLFAIAGGYIGSQTELLVQFFSTWFGWIVAILLLNAVPMIARSCIHSTGLGLFALAADGFLSGIVISPILWLARQIDPEIIVAVGGFTAIVFAAVTIYVFTLKKEFSAPRVIGAGIFLSLIAATGLNFFLNIGILAVVLSAGLAIFGIFILVINTSRVLNNPEATGAIPGALLLFAGLFNVFVGTLNIVLRILSLGRRR
jgi:FtsH-binding integral membrane protein